MQATSTLRSRHRFGNSGYASFGLLRMLMSALLVIKVLTALWLMPPITQSNIQPFPVIDLLASSSRMYAPSRSIPSLDGDTECLNVANIMTGFLTGGPLQIIDSHTLSVYVSTCICEVWISMVAQ
jgi:hypothetical protein